MKRFISTCLFCFIFFLLICFGAEIYVGTKNTVYAQKYQHVHNNPAITTLLIGNSYFEHSTNPHLIQYDSIYTFATSGRWIYWDVLLAERLFPTMQNLHTVLFPMGYDAPYFSLHYYSWNDGDKIQVYYYSKYMHAYYDKFPEKYLYRSALYVNKMTDLQDSESPIDSLGYSPVSGMQRKWDIEPSHSPTKEIEQICYDEYVHYLIELARICVDNNLRFVVVTCPCANHYVSSTCDEGINKLYAIIDSVKTAYPVEYYNYLNDVEFRADSIYYNANHLNSTGADLFAIRLKKDLGL